MFKHHLIELGNREQGTGNRGRRGSRGGIISF